jgi:hypothetical protein
MHGIPEIPKFVNMHSQLAGSGASLWRRSPVNIDARAFRAKKKRRREPAL